MSCDYGSLPQSEQDRIGNRFDEIRMELSTTTDVDMLTSFATAPDTGFRESIASNAHTPAEVLRTLSRDSVESVRQRVAENTITAR